MCKFIIVVAVTFLIVTTLAICQNANDEEDHDGERDEKL